MKNIIRHGASFLIPSLFPAVALAQAAATTQQTQTLKTVMTTIVGYLSTALELIMGVAVVMFVFYIVKYFIQANDKRDEAWQYVLWSLFGFFIIFSLWGLVNVLMNSFGLTQAGPTSWTSFMTNIFPNQ